MLTVAVDATEGRGPRLRGWGRYVAELVAALRRGDGGPLRLQALTHRGPVAEVVWEQVGLPLRARAAGAQVLHAPNCFLPLVRPCPGVVTVHDLAFERFPADFPPRTRWKYRQLGRAAARSAERVVCVSGATRDDVCARWGVDPERVRVVPLAPALPLGSESPPPGPYVLGIGDLRAKKNWTRLVAAWRALRADGLPHRLVLAGLDTGAGAELRRLAGPEPLELPGWVPDGRLDALLRGADLLVHPSLHEGFGLVALEAQVRGCPVALANATSLPEAGGEAAVYFDPLDPAAIAAAMRAVLDDPARAAALRARGPARAREFTWARTAAATAAVYRELT